MIPKKFAKLISEKFRKEWEKNNYRFSDGKSIEIWIRQNIEDELQKIRKKLTYEERILWFVQNNYETGMEYSILLESMKDDDLDNFKWYNEIIKIPKYKDEL